MDARELLQHIELRGGVATLTGEGSTAKINVAPRSLARELLPDLQKFKLALLELLQAEQNPTSWRDRDAAYWEQVRTSVAPGAQTICRVLQDYSFLFDLYRHNALPSGGCRAVIVGETHDFENATEMVGKCLYVWAEKAATCSDEKRDLTLEEDENLDETRELLEWLNAANDGDRWLDLVAVADGVTK